MADPANNKVNGFLSETQLARLATVSLDTCQPHVVPVWYLWDGTNLWISSYRSTRKIHDLEANPFCSVVIDQMESPHGMTAFLCEGRAELITAPPEFVQDMATRIYERYLGKEGVLAADPQEWIHSPENLIIKLTPSRTWTW